MKIIKKYVTLIKNKKIEVGGTMKTFLKGLWGLVEIIIIIYVICMTAFLLCKNKYGFTEIGNMSFFTINENLAEYLPETKDNDLLLVKSSEEDIKVGDKIYYYATANKEYIIRSNYVREIVASEDGMSLYKLDDEDETTIAATRVIGKYSTIYHDIGGVLDVLQSRIGFLLLVILPILIIFMYQIYALIIVIKYGQDEVENKQEEVKKIDTKKDNDIELL